MKTTAMISATRTTAPTQPATTSFSLGGGSETGPDVTTCQTTDIMRPVSQARPRSATPDPREQVVLGQGRLDVAGDQLEVLGRPHLRLDLARHREPRAVGVDLGGVGQQRLVADPEEVAARHPG